MVMRDSGCGNAYVCLLVLLLYTTVDRQECILETCWRAGSGYGHLWIETTLTAFLIAQVVAALAAAASIVAVVFQLSFGCGRDQYQRHGPLLLIVSG